MGSGIDLWWIPLGANGRFVQTNGRIYEFLKARREHRERQDLYHSALEVHVGGVRYVVENAWPIPDADGASRGVVVDGPVFHRRLGRLRALRYEVRRWPDGVIADASWAPDGPVRVSTDPAQAALLLDLVPTLPGYVWGRRQPGTDEMWNSNSTIAWLLARAGLTAESMRPPEGGRAPGWDAGVTVARREPDAGRQMLR